LVYRSEGKGFLLYSVGVNGIDEQGETIGSRTKFGADDLVIRVPLPPLPD
jgi:hypothetical protein